MTRIAVWQVVKVVIVEAAAVQKEGEIPMMAVSLANQANGASHLVILRFLLVQNMIRMVAAQSIQLFKSPRRNCLVGGKSSVPVPNVLIRTMMI